MEKSGVTGQGCVLRPKEFNISRGDLDLSSTHEVKRRFDLGTPSVPKHTFDQGPNPSSKGVVRMARRNARERNRVKQVNQGFVTLRHHLPEPFRMKRMSKVDTLRSALGYILSLEKVLVEDSEGESAGKFEIKEENDLEFSMEDEPESKEN